MRSGRRGVVSRDRSGGRLLGRAALVGMVWGALASPLSGCQLALDFAPLPDGAPPDAPVDIGCDTHEPNEDAESAAPFAGSTVDAAICGDGDRDFYAFSVAEGEDVTLALAYAADLGNLDLELWAAKGTEAIEVSIGTTDEERIERSVALGNPLPAGDYAVGVVGSDPKVENSYQLTVTIIPAADDPAPSDDPDAGV